MPRGDYLLTGRFESPFVRGGRQEGSESPFVSGGEEEGDESPFVSGGLSDESGGKLARKNPIRQNSQRMNIDFLNMKQAGGNMSWEDFKKMWKSPKGSSAQKRTDRYA